MRAPTRPRLDRLLPDSWQGGSIAAAAHRSRARRILAALLVAFAAVAVVQHLTSAGATRPVLVAAHDLAAGQRLAATDLRTVRWPASAELPGILSVTAATGAVVDSPMRAGEPVTASRTRQGRTWAGSGDRVVLGVPVEPALAAVLARGDQVDVYGPGRLLATGAWVLQAPAATAADDWSVTAQPWLLLSVRAADVAALTGRAADDQLRLVLHPKA